MTILQQMTTLQKIALGVLATAMTAQSIGGLIVLKHLDKVTESHKILHEAGLYLITILEREEVELTEFDGLALSVIMNTPKK